MVYRGGPAGPQTPAFVVIDGTSVAMPYGQLGTGLAIGDLDGDGRAELVIGDVATVFVYAGTPTGIASTYTKLSPMGVGGSYGYAVSAGGDLNGDGYGDLAVGARDEANFHGTTYVYLGSTAGLSSPTILPVPSAEYGSFGAATACGGDTDRDGYDDLVVGAVGYMTGAAFVIRGTSTGLSLTPTTLPAQSGVDYYFGVSVARSTLYRNRGEPDDA